jgi:hypothetical protein
MWSLIIRACAHSILGSLFLFGAWPGKVIGVALRKICELAALELENGFRIEAKFPDHGLKAQTGGPAMMRRGVARYPYSCG